MPYACSKCLFCTAVKKCLTTCWELHSEYQVGPFQAPKATSASRMNEPIRMLRLRLSLRRSGGGASKREVDMAVSSSKKSELKSTNQERQKQTSSFVLR